MEYKLVKDISWEEIYEMWSSNLLIDRVSPIQPVSTMQYLGGIDMTIREKYSPTFLVCI